MPYVDEALYQDCKSFAQEWFCQGGSVQKIMMVTYFRDHFPENKYRYNDAPTAAQDHEIEAAFAKWNETPEDGGLGVTMDSYGMYLGLQINKNQEQTQRAKEEVDRKKKQFKAMLDDFERKGIEPAHALLVQAMDLEVIERDEERLKAAEEAEKEAAKAKEAQGISNRLNALLNVGGDDTQKKKDTDDKNKDDEKKSSSSSRRDDDKDKKSSSSSSSSSRRGKMTRAKSMSDVDGKHKYTRESKRKPLKEGDPLYKWEEHEKSLSTVAEKDDKKSSSSSSSRSKPSRSKSSDDIDVRVGSSRGGKKDDKKSSSSTSSSKDKKDDKKSSSSSSKDKDKDKRDDKKSSSSSSKDKDKKDDKKSSSSSSSKKK